MNMTTNRRSFLFGASVAGFGILVQGKRSLAWGVGPNDVLNIACIGVGGKGDSDTRSRRTGGPGRRRVRHRPATAGQDGRAAKGIQEVQRLSRAAARARLEDRRGGRLHARSHSRPGRGDGDAPWASMSMSRSRWRTRSGKPG